MEKLYNINFDFSNFQTTNDAKVHWYSASFIPQIPNLILSHLAKPSQTVLDPFCGSGVTIQESTKLGLHAIGMDFNPIATLVNKVLTTYYDPIKLNKYIIDNLIPLLKEKNGELIPNFSDREYWYHPQTLKELGSIKFIIESINSYKIKNYLNLAFSSILKKCCTQKDHYTYIADNMFPKDITERSYVPALSLFERKLLANYHILYNYYEDIKRTGFDPKEQVNESRYIEQDAMKEWPLEEKVDIIFTSPPYAGVVDYNRGQRLSFYWFPEWNMDKYLKSEIGARTKRRRKTFFDRYLKDLAIFLLKCNQHLKKNGYLVLIVGQTSSVRRKEDLIKKIREIAMGAGFELIIDKLKRSIHFKQIGIVGGVRHEDILIFNNKKTVKNLSLF